MLHKGQMMYGTAISYDKLKPFEFPLHDADDGFSKKVLWLAVIKSNNNSVVLVVRYLIPVKEHGACAILLKIAAWLDCNATYPEISIHTGTAILSQTNIYITGGHIFDAHFLAWQ